MNTAGRNGEQFKSAYSVPVVESLNVDGVKPLTPEQMAARIAELNKKVEEMKNNTSDPINKTTTWEPALDSPNAKELVESGLVIDDDGAGSFMPETPKQTIEPMDDGTKEYGEPYFYGAPFFAPEDSQKPKETNIAEIVDDLTNKSATEVNNSETDQELDAKDAIGWENLENFPTNPDGAKSEEPVIPQLPIESGNQEKVAIDETKTKDKDDEPYFYGKPFWAPEEPKKEDDDDEKKPDPIIPDPIIPDPIPEPTPEPVPTPTPEEIEIKELEDKVKEGIGFIGQKFDAETMAHDIAMEMNERKRADGGKLHRFTYRLWQDGIASNLYHRKYTREAMTAIKERGLHSNENLKDTELQSIVDTTIEQFLADEKEGTVHYEAGEERKELSKDHELVTGSRELIRLFCLPDNHPDHISASKLQERRTMMLSEYKKKPENAKDDMVDAEYEVDNLLGIAMAVKGLRDHGKSTEYVNEMLDNVKFVKGESRSLVRTEAHLNTVERVIDKFQHTRFGSLVGTETVAVAVSIAAGVAKMGSQSLLSATARLIGLSGASAGLWAGLRKNMEMKVMRSANARDDAFGKEWDPNDKDNKLRKELDPSMYDRRSSGDLLKTLTDARARVNDNPSPENIQLLVSAEAEIDARTHISDAKKIDLIVYSNTIDLGRERLVLDRARADARVALEGLLTPEMRAQLNLDTSKNIVELFNGISKDIADKLDEDVEGKDKVFDKIKAKKVFNAFIVGTITGILTGAVIQEGIAAVNPHTAGLVEQLWHAKNTPSTVGGIQHETFMHGILGEHTSSQNIPPADDFVKHMLGKTEINISSDSDIVQDPNGLFSVVDRNGVTQVTGLELDPNTGDLTQPSILLLENAKHTVIDNSFSTEKIIDHGKQVFGGDEWLKTVDPKDLTHIHHLDWWRNLKNVFDHNELKLWWGGNNGVSTEGYVLDASHMTSDGSWNDSGSVNPHEVMKNGLMKFLVYADRGDDQAISFDVNPEGKIIIPFDSKGAELFSTSSNGSAVFNGGLMEVVQTFGVDPTTGAEGIIPFASELGKGMPSGWEPIIETVHNAVFNIVSNGSEVPVDNFTEVLPGVPFYKTEKLGVATAEKIKIPTPIDKMYYGGGNIENMREWIKNNPSLLKKRYIETKTETDSNGKVKKTEVWHEADGSPVVRSVDREKATINEYIERQRASDPNHIQRVEGIVSNMAPMSEKCRVSINVPAYMEGKILKNWLEQFSNQVDKNGKPLDPETYEMNVIVNRKTGMTPDNSVAVIEEYITQYKSNHGGLAPKINYCDVEIDPPNNNVGYARKLITDATVMRSVKRASQDGCLYIETEDADVEEVDKNTVSNLIAELEEKPYLDAVRGTQERDRRVLKQNDLLLLQRLTWDYFEMESSASDLQDPTNKSWNYNWNRAVTGGWNTGYSAEAYSAIDGYERFVAGEDMNIGEKATMIRGDGNNPNLKVIDFVNTISSSSPRRFIEALTTGKGPYDNFGDEVNEANIRNLSTTQLLEKIKSVSRINESNKGKFEGMLNHIPINCLGTCNGDQKRADDMTRHIMFLIGMREKNGDYELKNNHITIKNWQRLKDALDDNRIFS